MTVADALQRTPRERYRVYSEREFLADPAVGSREHVRSERHGRGRRRVAGAAILIGALGSGGTVTAAALLPSQRHSRVVARAMAWAPARPPLGRTVPAEIDASAPATGASPRSAVSTARRRAPGRRVRTVAGSAARLVRAPAGSGSGPAITARRRTTTRETYAAASAPSAAVLRTEPGIADPRVAAIARSQFLDPARRVGEFGFER